MNDVGVFQFASRLRYGEEEFVLKSDQNILFKTGLFAIIAFYKSIMDNFKINDPARLISCVVVFLLISFGCAFADIKLPAIIADNMVLQQKAKVTLWGWAEPGEDVEVLRSWAKAAMTTKADEKGNWKISIATPAANGISYTLTFKGKNTIEVKNVLMGEVWLCSGQSNMEFTLAKGPQSWETGVNDYEMEVAKVNNPKIRMYTVKQTASDTALNNTKGNWQEANPQNARMFSAVAYYYAREIFEKTGIPIGLINSTWGGTEAEVWTRKDILQADPDLNIIVEHWDERVKNYPQELKKYEAALIKWKADTATAKQQNLPLPKAPGRPVIADAHAPGKLYNGMIAPIVPYTIKGVIWYQGESNAPRAYQYRKLFPTLITSWRSDHHDNKLPFYFVQISPNHSQNAEIREAQLMTYRNIPHTGMAVTTDNGDSLNIHPRNKELVGKRLALWALSHNYGFKSLQYSGPLYKGMKVKDGQIRIMFDEVGNGLVAKNGELKEFVIAGDDQVFYPGQAKIDGKTLIVSSPQVPKPVAVRFAWRNVPHPNLYNTAGLPASPFRTDNWKGITEDKN
jgi:sialate O-acetylesterase